MTGNPLQGAVNKATNSSVFEFAARAGHTVSGIVHLLIAYIIVQIAIGAGGNADQSGALGAIARNTSGAVALWVGAAGLAAMALWRVAEAVVGAHPSEAGAEQGSQALDRLKALGLAVVYFALTYSAVTFAIGSGKSSGRQNAGLSARLMQSGWGIALLVVVALVVVAIGGYHVYKGASKNFLDDLNIDGGRLLTPLGVTGYVAKGLVLVGAGLLLIVAVVYSEPAKATGIDGAVKTLGAAPFGRVLLIAAALGVAAYGVYSFVMARYARM